MKEDAVSTDEKSIRQISPAEIEQAIEAAISKLTLGRYVVVKINEMKIDGFALRKLGYVPLETLTLALTVELTIPPWEREDPPKIDGNDSSDDEIPF